MIDTSIDRTSFGHHDAVATKPIRRDIPRSERFGVIVPNSCMSPRFNPGDMLIVERTTVPRSDEDVLVEVAGRDSSSEVILGRLTSCSDGKIILRHLNPGRTVKLPRYRIRNIYAIIGCEFANRRIRRRVAA
jgi:hypothetical protein